MLKLLYWVVARKYKWRVKLIRTSLRKCWSLEGGINLERRRKYLVGGKLIGCWKQFRREKWINWKINWEIRRKIRDLRGG